MKTTLQWTLNINQTKKQISSPNFDELSNETWFKSNEICTFVPYITRKYEPLDPRDQKGRFKATPLKRICACDEAPINESSDDVDSIDKLKKRVTNSKTSQVYQLQKMKI